MSRSDSDSDVDLAKYMPTVEASLRLADHAAAEERVRRALEDPELQAVLAAEGRSVEFTPVPPPPGKVTAPEAAEEAAERALALARHDAMVIDPRSIEKVRRMADAVDAAKAAASASLKRASAPSPWASKATAAEVDEAALPSATVKPVPEHEPRADDRQRGDRRLPMWTVWAAAGTIAAVLAVLLLARSLGPHPRDLPVPATATAGATASAAPSAPSATPSTATLGSSDVAPAPPATSSTPSAAPLPVKSAPTVSAPPKPRNTAEDPYDAAPAPAVTPTAAPSTTVTPSVAPAPSPSASTTRPQGPTIFRPHDE